jgi:hypothetical protein
MLVREDAPADRFDIAGDGADHPKLCNVLT